MEPITDYEKSQLPVGEIVEFKGRPVIRFTWSLRAYTMCQMYLRAARLDRPRGFEFGVKCIRFAQTRGHSKVLAADVRQIIGNPKVADACDVFED